MNTFFAILAVLASDPLFSKMAGDWVGEGERLYPVSQRRVQIRAEVHAGMESVAPGDRLISRNTVTETALNADGKPGESHTYVRIYWMRAKLDEPNHYQLGYGEGTDATVTAEGVFQNDALQVEQEVGGLTIQSQTQFTAESTLYVEKGISSGTPIFETHLRYHHAP